MSSRAALCFLLLAIQLPAHAEVWVCPGENGTREYRNTSITKNCRKLDLQGVSMIPAPAARPAAAKPSSSTGSTATAAVNPAAAGFPRVDAATQRARDSDRMQILSDELRAEEKKLAALRQEYNNGEPERRGDERNYQKYLDRTAALKEDIQRAEKNVEALKRELGNLK